MATIIDSFGSRGGGFLPPPRNNNPLVPSSTQLASRDIGDIIVKSLETITEAFEEDDVPVNSKQIEDAVAKGINKSDLVKKGKFGSGGAGGKGSVSDEQYAKKLYQQQQIEYKKYLEREEQKEKESRDERNKELKEKIDKTFNNLNEFSRNPLKGFSNVIDKGVKGFATALMKSPSEIKNDLTSGWNKFRGKKPVTPSSQYQIDAPSLSSSSEVMSSSDSSLDGIASNVSELKSFIINDNRQDEKEDAEVLENREDMNDTLDDLLEEDVESNDNQEEVIEGAVQSGTAPMYAILLGIAGGLILLPMVLGGLSDFILKVPYMISDIEQDLREALTGKNSIGARLGMEFRKVLKDVKIFGTPLFSDKQTETKIKNLEKEKKKYSIDSTVENIIGNSNEEIDSISASLQGLGFKNDEFSFSSSSSIKEMENVLKNLKNDKSVLSNRAGYESAVGSLEQAIENRRYLESQIDLDDYSEKRKELDDINRQIKELKLSSGEVDFDAELARMKIEGEQEKEQWKLDSAVSILDKHGNQSHEAQIVAKRYDGVTVENGHLKGSGYDIEVKTDTGLNAFAKRGDDVTEAVKGLGIHLVNNIMNPTTSSILASR